MVKQRGGNEEEITKVESTCCKSIYWENIINHKVIIVITEKMSQP
jgi:hypothetical protein